MNYDVIVCPGLLKAMIFCFSCKYWMVHDVNLVYIGGMSSPIASPAMPSATILE